MRRSSPAAARRGGFTLIELIVASVIATMLAGAATISMWRVVRARDVSRQRQEAMATAQAVVDLITRDVACAIRDYHPDAVLVRVTSRELQNSSWEDDELLLFARSRSPIRSLEEQAEGDAYEVQYRVEADPADDSVGILWRRRDPVPDETYDGGGVAVPITSGILSLRLEASDGRSWFNDWDSDRDGLPYAIRVTCWARIGESEFALGTQGVAALDRTPIPTILSEQAGQEAIMDAWGSEPLGGEGGGFGTGGGGLGTGGGGGGGGRPTGGNRR